MKIIILEAKFQNDFQGDDRPRPLVADPSKDVPGYGLVIHECHHKHSTYSGQCTCILLDVHRSSCENVKDGRSFSKVRII